MSKCNIGYIRLAIGDELPDTSLLIAVERDADESGANTMPTWLEILLGVLGGLALLWGALMIALAIQYRRTGRSIDWREVARLAPDVVRLVKRLAADKTVPRATRWWLIGLLIYLIIPIDLVPDFFPVIGYLDDAIIVAVALRFAVKHAGVEALERAWPGTPAGLASVLAITRARPGRAPERP